VPRAKKRRAEKARSTRARPRPARGSLVAPVPAALAVLLLLAWLVPLTRDQDQYPEEVAWYWAFGSVGIAGLALVLSLIRSPAAQTLAQRCGAALMRPSSLVFATIAAVTAASLAATFADYMFRRRATTSDEIAQLWQAKILLHGRLSLPPDPNPEFFALENVIDSGRWYAQFPIGGSLVLVPGALIGAPWLVNPVLLAVAVLPLYWFARRVFGEMQGRAIAALFAVTPMVLFMAGTLMNHVSVLCLVTIALAALMEWERSTTTRRAMGFAAVIGIALGFTATIRPLDAIIVAAPIGVFQLWVIRRDWRRIRELAIQAVFGVIGTTPVLYANTATTGSPFRFGYEVMWGAGHQIGFRVDPYGNVHTVGRALEYGMRYLSELNMSLVAWPIPALLIVIVGLLAFRRATRWDVLLIALLVAQVCAYASYSLVGELLGPRFLYTALPTLVVILARAPFLVGERAGRTWQRATLVTMLACMVVSWSMPWQLYSVLGLAKNTRNSRRVLKIDITSAVREANIHNAVVFLHEPLGQRLLRRLWGLGMSRSDAARLLEATDACSLVAGLRAAEADTTLPPSGKRAIVMRAAVPYQRSRDAVEGGTPRIRISSFGAISPTCREELQADRRIAYVPFGPALPLEPIGPDGRIDGDVIYAADLGDHNEVLRARFGDRTWHRLTAEQAPNGELRATITPY
jgi:hypothetical protein